MIEITVGICSRNRGESLEAVLRSLADQSLDPHLYEAVVVDDGSADDTPDRVQYLTLELPYSLTYCRQEHSGLATARNTGLRASRGKVVLYIDDDVLADRDLLAQHLQAHREVDRCVCNGWVNHVTSARRPVVPQFTMADISTSFFWTSNVSVKRAHLLEAGAFDEQFKEYGWEDQELGLRLMKLGLIKHNNFQAVGYHIKRPPVRSNIAAALHQAAAKARSARVYIRKHPRLRSRLSTGLVPHRQAWAAMTNIGGGLEACCRHVLGIGKDNQLLDGSDSHRCLTGPELWCLRQLATVVYFRGLREDL